MSKLISDNEELIKAVKEGTKTQEEYKEWLLSMQSQKIIKEAVNGID